MTFDTPWYALLLLTLPLVAALYTFARRRKKAALDRLIGAGMGTDTSNGRRLGRLPRLWTAMAVIACLVAALMQPLWGKRTEDMPRSGRDIVLLLDTSLSMLAEDVDPNRIERAKGLIRHFVGAVRKDGGHRLALVAFAGRPMLQCPLTLDYDLFLQRLDETTVETVAREGSLIGEAVHHALERLGGLQPGFADVILLTDGEDHGGLPLAAASTMAAAGIDLYTLGIGDTETGAPIPVVDSDGERRLLEHDGFEVRSHVQTELLAEMAGMTQGGFLGADATPDRLVLLYRETLDGKPRRQLESENIELPAHRFQWFVLLALILLIADQLRIGWSARSA